MKEKMTEINLHRPNSTSPLRSLTPSRSFPLASLSQHHSCLNYLRDPSMKRYMEHICSQRKGTQTGHSYTRSSSTPPTLMFSTYVPSASSHFARVSSPEVSAISSSMYAPKSFHAERFLGGEPDIPEPPSSLSNLDKKAHENECNSGSRAPEHSRFSFPGSNAEMDNTRNFSKRGSDDGESVTLAVVDMGTNSFHIVVAKANSSGEIQVLDSEKEYVQLGSGALLSLISPDAEARAFEAMKRFKALALAYDASLRIVATSAVREAGNRGAFLSSMYEKLGVKIEVLSGKEEACLIYHGVLQALPLYDRRVLVIDIGGGSTEFVLGMAGSPIYAMSIKLGHLRLTDLFIGSGNNEPITKNQLHGLRKYVQGVLKESGVVESIRNGGFELAIGSSGTIETVEQIVNQGYSGDCATLLISEQSHLGMGECREREFTREELSVVVRKLCKAKNNEQRAKVFGLSPKRAEVLVAGAVLLEEIFLALNIHKMKVSPYALREGVILDTLLKTCKNLDLSPNVRWNSVIRLARRFSGHERFVSASHSARIATDILTGLKMSDCNPDTDYVAEVLSPLDDTDIELLEASVTLHAIGVSISFRDYHKHSHYLIKNNDILVGYSRLEMKIMALLAKYHRKKATNRKDEEFSQLPAEVQRKMRVLCAISRIAIALNRCHNNAVKTVHVIREGDACVLVVVPFMNRSTNRLYDLSLELWAAQDKLEYFEKVFKWKASIVLAHQSDENSFKVDDFSDR